MVLLVGIMSPASELSETPKHIIFFCRSDLFDRRCPPCLAVMEKMKAAIPGTAEHKFKKEEKAVQKDETKAMDAGNKMQMNEKNKLESHVPGTTDHKLTHQ